MSEEPELDLQDNQQEDSAPKEWEEGGRHEKHKKEMVGSDVLSGELPSCFPGRAKGRMGTSPHLWPMTARLRPLMTKSNLLLDVQLLADETVWVYNRTTVFKEAEAVFVL